MSCCDCAEARFFHDQKAVLLSCFLVHACCHRTRLPCLMHLNQWFLTCLKFSYRNVLSSRNVLLFPQVGQNCVCGTVKQIFSAVVSCEVLLPWKILEFQSNLCVCQGSTASCWGWWTKNFQYALMLKHYVETFFSQFEQCFIKKTIQCLLKDSTWLLICWLYHLFFILRLIKVAFIHKYDFGHGLAYSSWAVLDHSHI